MSPEGVYEKMDTCHQKRYEKMDTRLRIRLSATLCTPCPVLTLHPTPILKLATIGQLITSIHISHVPTSILREEHMEEKLIIRNQINRVKEV